jgi:hypothetical protein
MTEKENSMIRSIHWIAAAAVLSLASVSPAFADNQGKGQGQDNRAEHQSACGAVHGAFADENGNFGFLGSMGGAPGYHDGARGQEAGATGYNNSHTDCQDN